MIYSDRNINHVSRNVPVYLFIILNSSLRIWTSKLYMCTCKVDLLRQFGKNLFSVLKVAKET